MADSITKPYEWLDALEEKFDDSYENLESLLSSIVDISKNGHLTNVNLAQIINNSKDKLKQMCYLWSQLFQKSQKLVKNSLNIEAELMEVKAFKQTSHKELEKLIGILDSAHVQTQLLKSLSSGHFTTATNLVSTTISENTNEADVELIGHNKREEEEEYEDEESMACNEINVDLDVSKTLIDKIINVQDYSDDSNLDHDSNEMCADSVANKNYDKEYIFTGNTLQIPFERVTSAALQDPRLLKSINTNLSKYFFYLYFITQIED